MSDEERVRLDAETVSLLLLSSSPEARQRAALEEYRGVPAYDAPGRLRWGDRVCAAVDCCAVVVSARYRGGSRRAWCCVVCGVRMRQRRRAATHRDTRRAVIAATVAARRAA